MTIITDPNAQPDEQIIGANAMNILVMVPCGEMLHSLFAYDLVQMMNLTLSVMPPNAGDIGLMMNIRTYIHRSRTELLEGALAAGATHVLWLDSDMRFPPDALLRLLQRDLPIVGINYAKREMPPSFVAIKKVPDPDDPSAKGQVLVTDEKSTGCEEVDALGFGCVLMETSALIGLPDPKVEPWFSYRQTASGDTIGEDVYFCKYMLQERLGQRIFVDHDLSWDCAHLGAFSYKTAHAAAARDDGSVNYEPAAQEAAD